MRGALVLDELDEIGVGIIPADAGSTLQPCYVRVKNVNHPRGCGEHVI